MVGIQTIDSVSGGVVLDERLVERLYAILSRPSDQERSTELESSVDADIASELNHTLKGEGCANLVIKFDTVYTKNLPESVQKRWECVTKAAATIKEENLDRVTLLPQSLFRFDDGKLIIVENRSQLTCSWPLDMNAYYSSGEEVTPVLKQLAKFIIRRGLENTEVKNIPFLYDATGVLQQPPRIVVVDLDKCRNGFANNGEEASDLTEATINIALFGILYTDFCGLFDYVNPNQFDAICDAAVEAGFDVRQRLKVPLRWAQERSEKIAKKMEKLQSISAEAKLFEDDAQGIIDALAKVSGEEFGKVATFEFQRTKACFRLAARAFKCRDVSGTIMKNEDGGIQAWVVHLPPRLENHKVVLPTFGCDHERIYPVKGGQGLIVLGFDVLIEGRSLRDFGASYEVHGPKFQGGAAL